MNDDCTYCIQTRKNCGRKLSKAEYLNKDGPVNPGVHSIQATAFIECWIKFMKASNPAAGEQELLDVLKRGIEQKEEQLKLKKRSIADEEDDDSTAAEPMRDGSIDTTPADTPPLSKKRLVSSPSNIQPELLTINTSTLRSISQDCLEDAPAESTLIPQTFSGTSTTNACPIQEHTGLFFKFEVTPIDFEPFPSLDQEESRSLDHEDSGSLDLEESHSLDLEESHSIDFERFPSLQLEADHSLDHEEGHSFDHKENHSLDHEGHSLDHEGHSLDHEEGHSLDLEENHSLEQGIEEAGDCWWRYMVLDGE